MSDLMLALMVGLVMGAVLTVLVYEMALLPILRRTLASSRSMTRDFQHAMLAAEGREQMVRDYLGVVEGRFEQEVRLSSQLQADLTKIKTAP